MALSTVAPVDNIQSEENKYATLEKQIVELFNATGQMNVLDVIEYVRGLQNLLRIADCPEIAIEHPNLLYGKVTEEHKEWAKAAIAKYESKEQTKEVSNNPLK